MDEKPQQPQTDPACDMPDSRPPVDASAPASPIRLRALVIGFILAVAICAVTPFNNVYRGATPLGGGHFPLAPFYVLIWLTLIAALLRKVFSRTNWLTGRELLTAWILMVLASGIAYTGLARTFFTNLTAPFHFATAGNRWEQILQPLLPQVLFPQSAEAVGALYDGLAGGRQMSWWQVLTSIPWQVWIGPLLTWGIFILVCYFVMLCMINLLNRQAMQNERMNFPLLRVPQMMEEAFDSHQLGGDFLLTVF